MALIEELKVKVRESKPEIVFPEGNDRRILRAAIRLNDEGDIKPIVLGDEEELKALAEKEGVKLGNLEILNPETYAGKDEMVKAAEGVYADTQNEFDTLVVEGKIKEESALGESFC
ncbi:phosphate acyltransferase [Peptoniphilus genitalis]